MADWLKKLGKEDSADTAKERLKLVLIHDRTNLTTRVLDDMKDELIEVISRHVAIDASQVKISMMHEGREQRLICDIPVKAK
ncbi:MAG: cell division topological specificity factor MinE [Chloroflexi bacterium]|jgi:cell division topological specificity factor|nr:cell division topological specificity factor MinE [Chloroflexota bacterium]